MSHPGLSIQLFISTQCSHCSQAIKLLTEAVKQGQIHQLSITNLDSNTISDSYSHIRSVPFIQIENFEFTGSLSQADIDEWLNAQKEGLFANYYFSSQLMDGNISKVESIIKRNPVNWLDLIKLASNSETKMQVRIGITSIFETLSSEIIQSSIGNKIINALINAIESTTQAIRTDLIYLLSLVYIATNNQKQTKAS